jgi:adenylate kinase
MYNIVLFGVQGSGKGTQAERLSAALGIPTIATGNLFRAEIERGTGLGREVKGFLDRGDRVPSEITIQMMSQRLSEQDTNKGFIVDGYPRTVEQAESLERLEAHLGRTVTDVVFLDISDEEAVRRLSGRRVCSNKNCETSYHVEFHKPATPDICDRCGSALIQRKDDVPDAISRRLELYHRDTAPLVDFYRKRGTLREIDGAQPIVQVNQTILAALKGS